MVLWRRRLGGVFVRQNRRQDAGATGAFTPQWNRIESQEDKRSHC